MAEAIWTSGLTRRFGGKVAVDRLDLRVERGEVFGFLGPNGAGKTTTVRLLNGVLSASGGQARILGLDVASQGSEVRRHTGVLTESPSLYEALTGRENLTTFGDLYGIAEDKLPRRVDEVLDRIGLRERADDRVGGYSKGMRQRLAIARALLHEPEVLFLDEPTASLDPVAARQVTGMLQELSRHAGRTVFLCTHNLDEAQRLCDRVGVIDRGVLRAIGTPQELARRLWQGLWVEIDLRGEPSADVWRAIEQLPAVHNHKVEEGKLFLELEQEEMIPTVVSAIASAGGLIYGVSPQQYSLEEIYFRIAGEDQEGGAA
jgi:ABC-2 type transport system ATP-binding protein